MSDNGNVVSKLFQKLFQSRSIIVSLKFGNETTETLVNPKKIHPIMLNKNVKDSINRCVLCWLATADSDGYPNVSPKEMFTYYDDHRLVIANIASPQSIKNIKQQAQVCVSFVDIFVQKGYKLKGTAQIIKATDPQFAAKAKKLQLMAGDAFPFKMLIDIKITQIAEIIAPRYRLYPETTEAEQIESAMEIYQVRAL